MAETLHATSHIAGDCPSPANALGSADGTWAGPTTNNVAWTSRWALDDPADPLTPSATQTVVARVRKTSHSTNPTCAISVYENGVLVAELQSATAVSSTTGVDHTVNFNSSAVSNPADVEIEVVGAVGGGNPSNRASLQVDAFTWTADTSVAAPSASGGSSTSVTVSATGDGVKAGSGGADSTVTVSTVGDGIKATSNGSDATVTVTANGGGQIGSEDKSGGSVTTVNVTATGDGRKAATGGSAVSITTSTAGDGEKTAMGGSDASTTTTATGDGTKAGIGGSDVNITVEVTGDGFGSVPDGGGGGDFPGDTYNGGSSVAVAVVTTGDGFKAAAGGSTASILVEGDGGGLKMTSGGSDTEVVVLVAGGGTSLLVSPGSFTPNPVGYTPNPVPYTRYGGQS